LVELYRLTGTTPQNLAPRYNIAPTQAVPIVRRAAAGGRRELVQVRWGLIPSWAKDEKIGYSTINARAETVAEKPAFRAAFTNRRCLVITDGFFEWRSVRGQKRKLPYYVRLAENAPFAFAGLWERWRNPAGEPVESCTIIVTAANALLAPIHDRMPVILMPERFDAWLDAATVAAARAMLVPYLAEMALTPVSTVVNSTSHEGPDCLEPVGPTVTARGDCTMQALL
jgi:putative SOS response-associated peptidase YedK